MQALAQDAAKSVAQNLATVRAYALGVAQGDAIAPSDAQLAALVSTVLLAIGANLLVLLLLPRGRKLVFDTLETVLASALIAILLAVVLGLPLGIIYLVLKAAAFLLNLLLSIPALANLLTTLRSTVGL